MVYQAGSPASKEEASRDPSETAASLLLAKSGGVAGRPISRLYFSIPFLDQILPVDKQLEASEAVSMGNSGMDPGQSLWAEKAMPKHIKGQQKLCHLRQFKSTFKSIFPTNIFSPQTPQKGDFWHLRWWWQSQLLFIV